jgi:hypothetical protein
MGAPREIFVPQAMQRHTGCAWVHPAGADEKNDKSKLEDKFETKLEAAADGCALRPRDK